MVVIAAVVLLVGYIIWPAWPGGQHPGLFGRPLEVRPGLDIQGGLRVLLAAQSETVPTVEQMEEVRRVIEQRVNGLGVSEPIVQLAGTNRVIVEIPGVSNPSAAIALVQQTALLEFVDFSRTGACQATMPGEGQYVLTDKQIALGVRKANTPAAPAAATQAATAVVTEVATAAATAEATAAATAAATQDATKSAAAALLSRVQATPDVTVPATVAPTATPQTPTATNTATNTTVPPTATVQPPTATNTNVPPTATAQPPTATPQATAEAVVATQEATPAAVSTAASTAEATAPVEATPDAPGGRTNPLSNPCTIQPFRTVATGAGLTNANAVLGGTGSQGYQVSFVLAGNAEGQAFTTYTRNNVGQPLAIVLDGQVISAPNIQQAITDNGQITGNFDREAATRLALQLRSGALPVSLFIESTEQVGASLGAQSVQASVRAGIIGVIVVLLFMIVYYRAGGVAAAIALLIFAGINFALYKYIPVTLTLSAITGFLISIGTAVDGNILVFERMKEELRAGKTVMKAIELGFTRAWPSIRESNISTILIALILYFFGGQFGASAVRGFAVTLILGLVTNLFTALIVTRTLLTFYIQLRGDKASQKIFGS